ncbi:MAG: hypothetical protein QXY94_02575 [Archaeoglobaceae archaeon]
MRFPHSKEQAKEELKKSIEKYLENVLKYLPEEERKRILEEIEKGRAIVPPQPRRE